MDGILSRCRSSLKISQRAVLSYRSDQLSSKHDTVIFTIFYLRNYVVDCFPIFRHVVVNNLLSDKKNFIHTVRKVYLLRSKIESIFLVIQGILCIREFYSIIIFSGSVWSIILKLCTCIQEALKNEYAKFQKYLKKIDTSR